MGRNDDVVLRFVVQRAIEAQVSIDGQSRGSLAKGLMILMGVAASWNENEEGPRHFDRMRDGDLAAALEKCADKLLGLRIFEDAEGKMNLSVRDVAAGMYVVSQFTLFADCKKGFRPGFSAAAKPPFAREVYEAFVEILRGKAADIALFTGEFAADMKVSFTNDGPVTILLDADVRGFR